MCQWCTYDGICDTTSLEANHSPVCDLHKFDVSITLVQQPLVGLAQNVAHWFIFPKDMNDFGDPWHNVEQTWTWGNRIRPDPDLIEFVKPVLEFVCIPSWVRVDLWRPLVKMFFPYLFSRNILFSSLSFIRAKLDKSWSFCSCMLIVGYFHCIREQTVNMFRDHIFPCDWAQSQDCARAVVWPMLYNLRERRIIRGPPGKPLSCRSAKRLQCQQISGTQLVPNRAGWHTHIQTQTLTRTHSNTNSTVIQHRPRASCLAKGLADGNALPVKGSDRGLQIKTNIWD